MVIEGPLRMNHPAPLSCDVLVIGGGLAATMAAITAAQEGASVIMAIKGRHGQSGSSSRAGGIIAAAFGHVGIKGEALEDCPENHAADTLKVGCGLNSRDHVRVLAQDAPDGVRELERLGVPFSKTDDGRFVQLQAPGNASPRACSVIGAGQNMMAVLGAQLKTHSVRLLEDTTALKLFKHGNHVTGAHAASILEPSRWNISAKATVLASGGATGIFPTLSGDPTNTGDGLILGYNAGAQLANLEFIEFTLIFQVRGTVLPIAGLAPFTSRGARMIDRDGAPVLERYYSEREIQSLGRAEMLRAVVSETAAGRAPVALDCHHFSQPVWSEFEHSQGSAVLDKIRDAGCDYRREPIGVLPAAHSILAGLVIDQNGLTGVTGLWAAGECATGIHGAARLSGNGLGACLVFGRRAGRNAARFAATETQPPPFAGRNDGDTAPPAMLLPEEVQECRAEIRTLAEQSLGVIRDGRCLAKAERRFREIHEQLALAPALTGMSHLAALGALMAGAALRREESRGLHFRTDHANGKASWLKWLVVTKNPSDGKPVWTDSDRLTPIS